MWIKDMHTGKVRMYGDDVHDALRISEDGRTLSYANLQNGDGSRYGCYRFVTDENGKTPEEDEVLVKNGADAYFDIGGSDEWQKAVREIRDRIFRKIFVPLMGEENLSESDAGVKKGAWACLVIIDEVISKVEKGGKDEEIKDDETSVPVL